MPPFSRHPMFGPMPPVSKLPVAETAFCWRKPRHYGLFVHVLASARGWVCLYYLATEGAATGDWRPKPNSILFVDWRGEGKVWSFCHTREDRHWPGGGATHLDLNGVRPRSEALSVGLQQPPIRRGGRPRDGARGHLGLLAMVVRGRDAEWATYPAQFKRHSIRIVSHSSSRPLSRSTKASETTRSPSTLPCSNLPAIPGCRALTRRDSVAPCDGCEV